MGQITSLSLWGLVDDDFTWRSIHMSFWRFFQAHDCWLPVDLGLHMTDHTHHGSLFNFVRQVIIKDTVFLRSLDISVESDNQGVMSIYPRALYSPRLEVGAIDQLVQKTQELYNLTAEAAKIRLHRYGRKNIGVMYAKFPEFAKIHEIYGILHYNHNYARDYGILHALNMNIQLLRESDEDFPRLEELHARGFDLDFKNEDIMRLETVPFNVYF